MFVKAILDEIGYQTPAVIGMLDWDGILRWLNLRRYFEFGPIANKRWQITTQSRKLEFPAHLLFKFSAEGSDLAPFIGNMTKPKIPSEIKPHLGI